jgi:D-alanyl-D-alanine carboxypeptidase
LSGSTGAKRPEKEFPALLFKERGKPASAPVIPLNAAGEDIVVPAVDGEAAFLDGARHRRLLAEVEPLGYHVAANESGEVRAVAVGRIQRLAVVESGFDMRQPAAGFGQMLEVFALDSRFHRSAIGVAADDDMPYPHHVDGILDGGSDAVNIIAGDRNHVTDGARDEQLAGTGAQDQVGDNARIGAGDEEKFGRLALSQQAELRPALRKHFADEFLVSLEEAFHNRQAISAGIQTRWNQPIASRPGCYGDSRPYFSHARIKRRQERMHRNAGRAAILALFLLIGCHARMAASQTVDSLDPAMRGRIDAIAAEVLKNTGIPSASVAVVQHGEIVYTHAYGLARLEPPTPATTEMRYAIGSISKQFTASAILLLQQEGKLSLDDTVGKYIPGLTGGDEVTIRELLSHTSGYQDYWPEDYVMPTMIGPETPQQIVDTWAEAPLDFAPGTKWQYSNTNFVIAGQIVEKVAGEPLMQFLTERIFARLGMKSVWNFDEKKLGEGDPAGYYRHGLGPLRPAPDEGRGWMSAAGELAMTAHDLALWDVSLLGKTVLSPESYKQMFTEVKLKDGKGTHYGLGVQVLERDGHRVIEHSGEVSGFVSDNEVLIDDGDAVAVLTNQDAVSAAGSIAHLVAQALIGEQLSLSPVEQEAYEIYRGLQQGEIGRKMLSPNLNAYFSEQALEDFKSSLGPLGEPTDFQLTHSEERGGMTFRRFTITYPDRRLEITTYTYPNGMLEQYLVAPMYQ